MLGIRRKGVSGTVVLILALLAVCLFGALLHALLPHEHGGNGILWHQLHAALHAAQTALFTLVLAILVSPVILAPSGGSACALAPLTRRDRLLWRGTEKYRRFG